MSVSRRQALTGMGGLALLGFGKTTPALVCGGGCGWQLPSLAGELIVDPAQLAACSVDAGSIVHHVPIAVREVRNLQANIREMSALIGW